jgi:hypothetical protein
MAVEAGEVTYLKVGDWEIHANGVTGTLRITSIDELGRVSGSVFEQPITGWWSERARRLTFANNRTEADHADDQAFEGYAWDEPSGPGLARVYHLAGSYETFGGGGGAKDRQAFGWFATLVCRTSGARGS